MTDKALTLWQPWASAIVPWWVKRVETRGWPCPQLLVGERIWIHAAATQVPFHNLHRIGRRHPDSPEGRVLAAIRFDEWDGFTDVPIGYVSGATKPLPGGLVVPRFVMPLGCLLGSVRVAACVPTDDVMLLRSIEVDGGERHWQHEPGHHAVAGSSVPLGNFTDDDRWAWLLDEPEPLETPVECRGRQRVWTIPPKIMEKIG